MKTEIYQAKSIERPDAHGKLLKLSYSGTLCALLVCLMFSFSVLAQTTLNPVADTDTQSDVAAGTNTTLNASQWNHLMLRFDLTSISGSVTAATLRIYQTSSSGAYTLNVNTTSTDSWNEGGTKPAIGTLITSGPGRTTAGYVDINVTAHVQTKMAGNKIVSVGLTTNLGSWTPFFSRQNATNKPQLVIITGTASNLTVSPATLNFGSAAGSSNVSVTSNVSWTVSDNQTWITTSPASGSNNGTVAVSVTANAGSASRSGTVTITGGSITRTVSVSQSGVSSPGTLDVNAITSSITVDGNLNEIDWSNTTTTAIAKTLAGTPNNTANFKARWSFTHLYVGVTVTDAAEFGDSPSAPWDDDAVEIYIDGNNNKSATYGSDDRQIIRVYTGSGIWTSSAIANIQHAVVNTASGYTVEIGIPWSSLGVTASTNKNVGFDAGLNDDDNGGAREHQTVWNGDGNNWSSTAAFGTIRLVGTPPSTPFLEVTPSSLSFSSSAGSSNITVSSNVSWTVTDNQSWISVSPASGSNNGTVAVSVTANAGASSRTGTVTITGSGFTRTVNITQGAPSTGMKMGTNFWNITWQTRNEFSSGVNWATTTNPWNPTFLQEMSVYSVIRPMDWVPTNNSTVSTWSQRIAKTANHNNTSGVAYEWQIDLCNRVGADLWVTIPHLAEANGSNDYARRLAELILDQLNSDLKVYVEYSNETWNSQFSQYQHCVNRSNQLGFGNPQGAEGAKFHVYAAVRIFREFENVFGINSPRLVKVIAGHSDNTFRAGFLLDAISDPAINPQGVVVNAYAVAPYFGHSAGSFTSLQNSMPASITQTSENFDLANQRGLKLIAYEGGQHSTSDAANINRNSGMYQLYTNYFNGIDNYLDVFCHYNHVSTYNSGGAWGAKEVIGQSNSSAHKYRAIVDYVNAGGGGGNPALSVEESAEELGDKVFSVHPNPATNTVRIVLTNDYRGAVQLSLMNTTGHVLRSSDHTKSSQNFETEVNLSEFNSGLYFVKIRAGKRYVQKLMKR